MSDTEVKQQYLCDSILDKGFDAEIFAEYLQTIRVNGSDIDQWTIEELRIVVRNFQIDQVNSMPLDYQRVTKELNGLNLNGSTQDPSSHEVVSFPQDQQTAQVQNDKESGQVEIPQQHQQPQVIKPKEEIDDNNYKRVISCIQSDPTQISQHGDLRIEVSKYEKKAGGIFSQSYIVYQIQTHPINSTVSRRYNDFAWLHTTLEKEFPYICIPPVPTKKSTRSFQPLFLSKRMAFMEKYLNKIISSKELSQSKYLEGFLVLTNEDQFTKLKKEGDKLVKQTKISSMTTSTGEANCVINAEINNFLKKTNDYLGNQDIIYKKVRKLCNQLVIDFDQLSTTLFSIGDCFSQSYNLSLHYNSLVTDKYLKFKDFAERDFLAFKQKLQVKKEKFWTLGDPTKWEIPSQQMNQLDKEHQKNKEFMFPLMFPKETQQEQELRDNYGFYNYSSHKEMRRLLDGKIYDYSQHFRHFSTLQSDHIAEMHVQWADLMTNMQILEEGEQASGTLMASSKIQVADRNPSEGQIEDDE